MNKKEERRGINLEYLKRKMTEGISGLLNLEIKINMIRWEQ